ncbi:3-dehydroquinate synthase [Magnetospira sp. QH-2]|uniref:3-dehydroquinate synthase n=1 Tax=Magnetospira sp. (strain QH-2) TaxID=1288970 RepID=UPI0005FA34F3|nr:3-dehydroquinate synthase [Magnetospira sp. QH-2]
MTAEILPLDLGDRSYDILIGDSLLTNAAAHMVPVLAQKRAIIVADGNTAQYAPTIQSSLSAAGIAVDLLPPLEPGEGTKDFAHLMKLVDDLLARRVERGTTLVALGGGVIGDLVGFAASVVLRGLPFIQVPTTLLAQVDSSVGGKTGINTDQGKNLVGAFYQPRLVLADVKTLETLDPRQLRSGYAEVLKYGLIDDPDFFQWLEIHGGALLDGDRAARRQAVLTSCRAKARVVAADERESGQRALLNLGHTFGHVLEKLCGYGDRLLHGEAVAVGMVQALDLSVRLGLCPADDLTRLRRHLTVVGLPTGIGNLKDSSWSVETMLDLMASDKKVQDGRVTFVLARGIGQSFLSRDVPIDSLKQMLSDSLNGDQS